MAEVELPWEYTLDIQKIKSSDGRRIIAGYASNEGLDEDEEIMDMKTLKAASDSYFRNGVVKFMHDKHPVWRGALGKVIPEYKDSEGVIHKTSFGSKPYLVIEVSKSPIVDPIWEMIQEGLYGGLSIGGKLLKRVKEFSNEAGKTVNRVLVKSWNETSIVDVPSAKGSFFTVLKNVGMSDEVEGDENNMPDDTIDVVLNRLEAIEKRFKEQESKEEEDKILKLEETIAKQAKQIEEFEKAGSEDNPESDPQLPSKQILDEVEKLISKRFEGIEGVLEKIEKSPMYRGNVDDDKGSENNDDVMKRAQNDVMGLVIAAQYFGSDQ